MTHRDAENRAVLAESAERRQLALADPRSTKQMMKPARISVAWVRSTRSNVPAHRVTGGGVEWRAGRPARLLVETACGPVIARPILLDDPADWPICDDCLFDEPTDEWVVYRYYAADGELLYVGCTGYPLQRMTQHSKNSAWWPQVRRQVVESYPTAAAGFDREREVIATERPRYNRIPRGRAA